MKRRSAGCCQHRNRLLIHPQPRRAVNVPLGELKSFGSTVCILIGCHDIAACITNVISSLDPKAVLIKYLFGDAFAGGIVAKNKTLFIAAAASCYLSYFSVVSPFYFGYVFLLVFYELPQLVVRIVVVCIDCER